MDSQSVNSSKVEEVRLSAIHLRGNQNERMPTILLMDKRFLIQPVRDKISGMSQCQTTQNPSVKSPMQIETSSRNNSNFYKHWVIMTKINKAHFVIKRV